MNIPEHNWMLEKPPSPDGFKTATSKVIRSCKINSIQVTDSMAVTKPATRLSGEQLINLYCKQALIHYTNSDQTIHFMLDGIDPALVLRETKAKRTADGFDYDDESTGSPRITSVELRALMRAAMRAKGLRGAKIHSDGQDVKLENVKFYLNNVEVNAPWTDKADSLWGSAWREYMKEREVERTTSPQCPKDLLCLGRYFHKV